MELAQLVQQEIMENPVLEELEEVNDDEKESDDETLEESEEKGETDDLKDDQADDLPDLPPTEISQEFEATEPASTAQEQEIDWDSYIQNNIEQGMSAESYTERPSIETTYKKEPSLADHLMWQLNMSTDTDAEKFIGSCIIGNIQSDGYLSIGLSELAEVCKVNEAEILRVLKIIHTFEPVGVGARSLKECLMIQAQSLPKRNPLMETLIDSYLEKLDERSYQKIASELKISIDSLIAAINKIKELSPKPGILHSFEGIDYITPDLIVVKTENGYDVALNNDGIPNLRINPYYHNLLKSTTEGQTKQYLENKYRSALWLIKSIDQRMQTIYKVGRSLVKQQVEFLDKGMSYLKPMVLKDVAKDIEMHESTVSRITTNKYIDTPQGIFELKFFFHSGIKSFMGDDMSSIRVKNMIKEVIASEDVRDPLTDDEMVEALMRKNAKIARRTITKYRKELNIPPANKRKKLF
ncbi:MAG: RNA polymerase sigma-54 factor [Nitrospinae bacterium RIFCSPLOWO2_12_FULL_47_7]|nr:MAG: RNA polymerase sigma-54 factor [Nitrospinae bacterium RIFCSPLOWO2_12_FULL_47_7]